MKTSRLIIFIPIFLLSCFSTAFSQNTLPLSGAILHVLKNNFDVLDAQQNSLIAEQNNSKGNAGLLPSVQLNGGANYSNNNTEINFAGGIPPTNVNGAVNNSYNGSISATYTLFNGFANINNYRKLQLAENMSNQQLQLTVENAVVTTIGLYLDLVKLQDDEKVIRQSMEVSQLRLTRLEEARNLGVSSSYDLLSARVDLNSDSANWLNIRYQKDVLKRQLNFLMGMETTHDFSSEIQSTDAIPLSPNVLDVLSKAKSNNSALVLSETQRNMAGLDANIAKANTMPRINLNTSYGLTNSKNAAGIVLEQNNLGFSSGINITLPIYSGGQVKTAMANAQINIDKSDLAKKRNEAQVEKEVYDQWLAMTHANNMRLLEEKNLQIARLSLDRASESLKLGQITSVEFRQAQLAVVRLQSEVNGYLNQAGKAKYQLLRLQGELVKD